MYKNSPFLLLILLIIGCGKNRIQPDCVTPSSCSTVFTSVGIHFTDNLGQPISIENFKAVNLRTHVNIAPALAEYGTFAPGHYIIADDGALQNISADGDEIEVSGFDPLTNQTRSAIVKIAGGCACHISKISGPDQIQFTQSMVNKTASPPYHKTLHTYLF
jgi:hypothetical protein